MKPASKAIYRLGSVRDLLANVPRCRSSFPETRGLPTLLARLRLPPRPIFGRMSNLCVFYSNPYRPPGVLRRPDNRVYDLRLSATKSIGLVRTIYYETKSAGRSRRVQMQKYTATEVFTPTTPAKLTFVERTSINDQLVSALKTPGKQVVVYGHTGSGKTTVLARKLEQLYESHITTRCTRTMVFADLLKNAFEQLEHFYDTELSLNKRKKISVGFEREVLRIKSQL